MTVSRNAHLTDLQTMKQHFTNLSETQKSKYEEEKTNLIKDLEKKNSISEDNFKKQLKEALHREDNHARGKKCQIFLGFFSTSFYCCTYI